MWIRGGSILKVTGITFLFTVFFMVTGSLYAQQEEEAEEKDPAVRAIARAYPDSIVVRWGVDNPVAWQLSNKYGFYMERFTLMKNGKLLEYPEMIKLNNQPLKPRPLEEWEALTEKDDYALIAAQAIYGETFELSENYSTDIMQVINKSRELEQRFSFALFAADMSAATAKASGLWFTDNNVKADEKYVYKIYAAVPEHIQKIDTGYVYVEPQDHEALPKPVKLEADFEDKKVMLSWDKSYYEHLYIAYKVERSEDGKSFASISDLPIINTEAPNGNYSRLMFKADSLPENYKTYYYRVRGLTAFGETGPPSDTVSGFGFKLLQEGPAITSAEVINNESVHLKWEFDNKDNTKISGFTLSRANKASGEYVEIIKNIPPDVREITDKKPHTTNYYKLTVKDEFGQSKASFPYLAQLIDSIPPVAPVVLIGKIDTSGVVTIQWAANTETDLLGYRVYRSNFKSDELSQVTSDPVEDTVFYDKIEIKTLTKTIYYKVKAVDTHYNPSEFSALLALERPDVMPPTSPVFTDVKATEEGIKIQWVNSTSEDVVNHLLYRRKLGEKGWKLLAVFNQSSPDTVYTDNSGSRDAYYEYTILAVDDSKLESEPASPVRAKRIDTGIRAEMTKVYAAVDRESQQISIAWEYDNSNVENYIIYRGREDEPVRIYKSLTRESNRFIDKDLIVNSRYYYRLQAVYQDGGKTPLSKKVEVKY